MTNKSTKKLSLKESWLYLAKLWETTHRNGQNCAEMGGVAWYGGLCPCIDLMDRLEQIAPSTHQSMCRAVQSMEPYRRHSIFKFPPTVEGAKMRAEFCRKQARKIKTTKIRRTKTTR